ncbi:DNA internalization-related competence protein ComEC/Rec2 [Dyella jiangningensis]|uniref:DNA internalization-related competence protein ComEC/Rec2 n=1 Tax=Dyella jiangningensis TaxID=1379159 RepID=A0A328NY65_9GAMM|nr:DNA internalization-related competence protein ComEC/Rec2 [Dyella jiangningensis]RAO75107.1 DNA internalization-related competence protein ComEC/Rec2 [Dyella jiangningensis]
MRKDGAVTPAIMLLIGVLMVQWLPTLPPRWFCLALAAVSLSTGVLAPRWRWLAWCAFGVAWACWRGGMAMDARLPRELEGMNVRIVGRVIDLPSVRDDATGFLMTIDSATLGERDLALRGRLRVNWYNGAPPSLSPCSRWQLVVRLKRPRGLMNPGGADAERSSLERGIVATGYVRDDPDNGLLTVSRCVDGIRAAISGAIAARVQDTRDAALLQAFAVGDIRGLTPRDWAVARANGIPHLLAISGFHVGVAAVFGVWLARLFYVIWPTLALRVPRVPVQAASALLVAGIYSALAGFGLPTVRTLLMIAVVALARALRRAPNGLQSLALALFVVLLFDPLCVLAAGFWLSFVGVAFLMVCMTNRGDGPRGFVKELGSTQLLMTVSLLPLTMWFFGQASLVGALSNLVAVPFVSFVIVPCTLVSMILLGICPPLASPVLWLAAHLAHAQWWLLDAMATWPGALWYLPEVRLWALLLAMLGAFWLFMPRGVPVRWLGGLLFLPLLLPIRDLPAHGGFQLWGLDVGQGLSVLVRTEHHALVYDAGARFPSDFDMGEVAVLPSLHALGIRRLDVLIASHADNDHSGGIPAVAAEYPDAERYSGEPERLTLPMKPCTPGQSWSWDGVTVSVLPSGATDGPANDRSCVLLVEGRGGRALLTGDITSRIEPTVLAAIPPGPPLVLTVPHHGSRTSSSAAFLAGTDPTLALISSGWRNRFGHPHPLVVKRYEDAGIPWLNSATSGAIEVNFPPDAAPYVATRWRQRQSRYWRE